MTQQQDIITGVLEHAIKQRRRGKRPSMGTRYHPNPREALAYALQKAKAPPMAGDQVSDFSRRLCALATWTRCSRVGQFNNIPVIACPGDRPDAVERQWSARMAAEHQRWKASPEGMAYEAERRRALATAQNNVALAMTTLRLERDLSIPVVLRWIGKIAGPADYIGSGYPHHEVIRVLEEAGYVRNAGVGDPSVIDGSNREGVGRWIIGLVIDMAYHRLGPHPGLERFARKWLAGGQK